MVLIFLLSRSFPWNTDDHKWFSDQHLIPLLFIVEFVYCLHTIMLACILKIFRLIWVFLVFKLKSPLLTHLNQCTQVYYNGTLPQGSFQKYMMAFICIFILIEQEKQYVPQIYFDSENLFLLLF